MTILIPQTQSLPDDLAGFRGEIIWPGEPGFDARSRAWNLAHQHRPSVIAIPADTADVARAVRFAARSGTGLTIQSSGHGVALPADGSLLLLMTALDEVVIDPARRLARIGGGAKWDRVLGPAQDVGLAPLLGSTPDVGAVGYTLGGGMGWLARKYGLNVDRVRSFTVVTADGSVRTASPTVHADLFWALAGGGAGSLGVVTEMEVELVPVTEVYAGNLLYPVEAAADVVGRYREWIADAPHELTSSIVFMNFPPFDDLPEFLRGQSFVIVRGCWSGPAAEASDLLQHWRSWRVPVHDLWGPMSFRDVALISNDPVDPLTGHSTTEWLSSLDDQMLAIVAGHVFAHDGPPLLAFAEVRHAGGAVAAPSARHSYPNRNEAHLLQVVGVAPDQTALEPVRAAISRLQQAIGPWAHGSAYLNFLEGTEKVARARQAFDRATWARLCRIKATYDPDNLFDHGLPLFDELTPDDNTALMEGAAR